MALPVIVSAAGRGTRMGDLTRATPKHLLEVNGKPFLYYLLRNLAEAGAADIFLVVGWMAEAVYAFARMPGLPKVTLINQFERLGEERYGTLMPLAACQAELGGSAVAAVNGDNLYSANDLRRMLSQVEGSAVAGYHHEEPQRFGVLVPQPGTSWLREIVEKPDIPPSQLINTGLYKLSGSVWGYLPQVPLSKRGEYELTQAVSLLAQGEHVTIVELADYWLDLGRPLDLAYASELITSQAS